jgi:predicted DNA-binding transcriptional regulator YafY
LARRALSSVEGSWVVRELDAVLERSRTVAQQATRIDLTLAPLSYQPDILRVLHEALTAQRKLRIHYRGASDATGKDRVVHPSHLQVVDQQAYLVAWDEQRRDRRTFKVTRISRAKLLRDKAQPQRADVRDDKAKSVKVWSSDPFDVRVRIAKDVERFINEWPLASNQSVEPAPRGATDVCARVYGLEETLRWVLRWGRHAEVVSPPALRQRVHEELLGALASYAAKRESSRAR